MMSSPFILIGLVSLLVTRQFRRARRFQEAGTSSGPDRT